MHELALSRDLVELIDQETVARGAERVVHVVLEIGILSHVDPHAMSFGFEAATKGSRADGATLEITTPPGEAWCMDCAETVSITRRGDGCPLCGGHKLMVTGGEEMRLKEMEIV